MGFFFITRLGFCLELYHFFCGFLVTGVLIVAGFVDGRCAFTMFLVSICISFLHFGDFVRRI